MFKNLAERKSLLCRDCRACCKEIHFEQQFPEVEQSLAALQFYRSRGLNVLVENRTLLIRVPHICQYLTSTGCSDYTNRPQACRLYDGRKDPFLKDICKWKELNNVTNSR